MIVICDDDDKRLDSDAAMDWMKAARTLPVKADAESDADDSEVITGHRK